MIVKRPQNCAADIFNNVSLSCAAVGKPPPTITWTKSGGTSVDVNDGHFKLLDDGTLFIQGFMLVFFSIVFLLYYRISFFLFVTVVRCLFILLSLLSVE